jgi:serine/threonine protein kinase
MFVALKQERFAGKDFKEHEVVHIFKQLLLAVSEMHSKSVLHADLKPLNLVRVNGSWRLIDLDAACVIGKDPVGFKSSSAFIPPEAVFIDRDSNQAIVKSPHNNHILIADPSFDVWSLGCLLYPITGKVHLVILVFFKSKPPLINTFCKFSGNTEYCSKRIAFYIQLILTQISFDRLFLVIIELDL